MIYIFQNYGDPMFNYTGPSIVAIGSSAAFRVDMFIPYPSVSLVFDAFAPINVSNVMSVCNVLVVDTGDHYRCLEKEKFEYTAYPADSGKGNGRVRLDLATVTNAGWFKECLISLMLYNVQDGTQAINELVVFIFVCVIYWQVFTSLILRQMITVYQ